MPGRLSGTHSEGLKAARLLMVLSSISPLFILWAIRGSKLVPDVYFIGICLLLIIVPNAILWLRLHIAKKHGDKHEIPVGRADDHRTHLLVYLLAMLLPIYSYDMGTWRSLSSAVAALGFSVFLFWHLNLHYLNIMFAGFGFRIFTVFPPANGNPISGRARHTVITRRVNLECGDRLVCYRISDTVYLELTTWS